MRVGLSAFLMHRGQDYRAAGVSVYTEQLVKHLVVDAPQNAYVVFAGVDAPPVAGARFVFAPLPTSKAPARIAWEQSGLPLQAWLTRIDVLHATVNVVPLLAHVPMVVTVHDLAFLRHPDRFHPGKARYLQNAVRLSVRRARGVIAVSNSTKADVVELLGVVPARVAVVPPGVDPAFQRWSEAERLQARESRGTARPFILHVGTLEPRKNIDVLIRAYARAREEAGLPHDLVLAGAAGWMYQNLFDLAATLGLQQHVHFLGYVPRADLPLWYNLADLFVYPSAYEGFGLPLLEAMASAVPCITSFGSSLEEVAGDACVLVEPGSAEALQSAIVRVLGDTGLQKDLVQRGLSRASCFSWHEAARRTAAVYDHVVGN